MNAENPQALAHTAPAYIAFDDYTHHIPPSIPAAVQQATNRFITGRAARVAELPHWEELREIASHIRLHTLDHLDTYLESLEAAVTRAGGHVHWADDAAAACRAVIEIANEHNVKNVVKAKSMATEEIGLNHALLAAGMDVVETDLGEYIIQLAGMGPSHIIVPAVHMKKEEIADLFSARLGVDAPPDPTALTAIARATLREKFLDADMGISGANFLVAETGTLVMVTNEGNGRMCTTLPDLHVAVVGIDKVVPDWDALTVLLKLLARSATGQKISTYTQFITGPRRSDGEYGPRELHLVLLDNGRTRALRDPVGRLAFKCIRCGACENVCPVYKNVGGYAYGWFISGPIGAIFTPQMLATQAARELPFASSLCGACADVCPVKIPIPDILRRLRQRVAEGEPADGESAAAVSAAPPAMPALIRGVAAFAALALSRPWLYKLGTRLLPGATSPLRRSGWLPALPYPFSRWTDVRPLPAFSARFRQWWKTRS